MSGKRAVAIPVVKPAMIEVSGDPRGDAMLKFETTGETDILLILPVTALAELEAMLARASLEQAKHQPKQ